MGIEEFQCYPVTRFLADSDSKSLACRVRTHDTFGNRAKGGDCLCPLRMYVYFIKRSWVFFLDFSALISKTLPAASEVLVVMDFSFGLTLMWPIQ